MTGDARASEVLAEVLRSLPPPSDDNGHLRVLDAWVNEDAVCIVYEGWWHTGTLGLRRAIEPVVPTDRIAAYILDQELGEPPGALIEGVAPDDKGITWWNGDDPAWRDY